MLEAITNILPFLRLLDITPYNATYDLPFVALSVGVAVVAMYVALSVADRIVASSRRPVRLIWTAVGAIVMGGGIWSMTLHRHAGFFVAVWRRLQSPAHPRLHPARRAGERRCAVRAEPPGTAASKSCCSFARC